MSLARSFAFLALAACGGSTPPPAASEDCPAPVDAGSTETLPDASEPQPMPDAAPVPCKLRADTLAPSRIPREGHVLLVMTGCGLLRTKEVRVYVYPTLFAILDDTHLAVYAPVGDWFDGPSPQAWPIVVKSDTESTEATLTYEPGN